MTRPEPARATVAVPLAQAHAELLADVASKLHLDDGLTRIILADSATEVPVNAVSSPDAASAVTVDSHDDARAALITDLESTLHLPEGVAEILNAESGHASLVADLSAAIDTARGLTGILDPASVAVIRTSQQAAGSSTLGMADNLSKIRAAVDHHRILLRAAHPHRCLEGAMRELRGIREYLARTAPGRDRTDPRLASVPAVLARQQDLMTKATAALADALPGKAGPQSDTRETEWRSQVRLLLNACGEDDDTSAVSPAAGMREEERGEATAQAVELQENERIRLLGARVIAWSLGSLEKESGEASVQLEELQERLEKLQEEARGEASARAEELLEKAAQMHAWLQEERGEEDDPGTLSIAAPRPEGGEAPEVDRGALAQIEQLMRQSADELGQLHERMVGRIGIMGRSEHRQCLNLADSLAQMMGEVWEALSDFQGADLRMVDLEPHLEDLDGVRWSDDRAARGATQWPATVRDQVIEHSVSEPETGVFVVRFGAAVSASR
jgi:hypothetical protein